MNEESGTAVFRSWSVNKCLEITAAHPSVRSAPVLQILLSAYFCVSLARHFEGREIVLYLLVCGGVTVVLYGLIIEAKKWRGRKDF